MKLRDSQRSKVYKAEQVLNTYANRLETVAEIHKYLRSVLKKSWIHNTFPAAVQKELCIKDGRGRRSAYCSTGSRLIVIGVPMWARKNWVLLHELAHALAWGDGRSPHGKEFCHAYLTLVEKEMGTPAYNTLLQSFKSNGIRFSV